MDVDEDGRGSINTTKMIEVAVDLATLPEAKWAVETSVVQPHPIQKPQPRSDSEG